MLMSSVGNPAVQSVRSAHRMSWDQAGFLAFLGAVVVCVLTGRPVGGLVPWWTLTACCLLVAVIGLHSGVIGALWAAAVGWLFLNGFVATGGAHLAWHGTADVVRLLALGCVALGSTAVARLLLRRHRPRGRVRIGRSQAHQQVPPRVPVPRPEPDASTDQYPPVGADAAPS